MATSKMELPHPKVVSPAEWLAARKEHLAKEKEFTKLRDKLSRERRELPWEKVEKQYVFDGPNGKETLADLFGKRHQLIVYHFMFGPGWKEGCPSCSYLADHYDGATVHLANRDVTLAVVSRATLPEIEAFKKRMGWRFKWVSSFGSDFNYDYHVSFTKDERPRARCSITTSWVNSPVRKRLELACSTKTRPARSSTPTPLTRAGLIFWWARTTFSTWRPRAAAKMAWPLRCHGFATTIGTLKATSSMRRNFTRRPLRVPMHHVAPARSTNKHPWCGGHKN